MAHDRATSTQSAIGDAIFQITGKRFRDLAYNKHDVELRSAGVIESAVSVPSQRKLLVLDLDETLLYATEQRLSIAEEFKTGAYYVYLRPHLRPFLEFCVNRFDVGVWTSSSADYAQAVVMVLFGSLGHLKFVWSRTRCTLRYDPETHRQYWVKDLRKIRRIGYPLERVIVIDDTAKKHERNYGNLVRVSAFEGQPDDNELLHLVRYLDALADVDNVRLVEKRGWRHRRTGPNAI